MTKTRRAEIAGLVALVSLIAGAQIIHQPAAAVVAVLAGVIVWAVTAPGQKRE